MPTVSLSSQICDLADRYCLDLKTSSIDSDDESGTIKISSLNGDLRQTLVVIGHNERADIVLDIIPGLCKMAYLDEEGHVLSRDEWLVFGGETALPTTPRNVDIETPFAILITNIGLV